MTPTVTLVRHGETDWSAAGRHTGRTDVPLTPAGRDRASTLAPTVGARPFALVLASPLARARDTAALAGFPDAAVDADLVEWDYGDYEGRTTAEIRAERPGWWLWRDGPAGGETIDQVADRTRRVVERCRAAGGDALLFAHGHVLRVLAAVWLGTEPVLAEHLELDPATVSVLGDDRGVPTIRRWNAAG